ncbi:TPA: ribosome biogenesis GTPase Der [Candidatus Falkowbacteria bacterium]|nr:ribosome biogenesis GTPase Der [Candidatus Falkowbacteria bacterium]
MTSSKLPNVVLLGRTNVGKSTLFNTLTETQTAIVTRTAGTTRNPNQGVCFWHKKMFNLIDTAGLDVSSDEAIDKKAINQAKKHAASADLNLLLVDAKSGLLPQDKAYALMLKKLGKPVILVINKVDSRKQLNSLGEFEKLGFKNIELVSAASGAGTGDFLDSVVEHLGDKAPAAELPVEAKTVNVAIVGKPNVGKSSLLNRLAAKEISITSQVANTTRDTKEYFLELTHHDEPLTLKFIDTAGLRREAKIKNEIDILSRDRSMDAIKHANIVLLIIDATEDITAQDKNITKEIIESSKSLIFVVNKWDLVTEKDTSSDKEFIEYIHRAFPYLTWAPVVFLSAKTGFKLDRLVKLILEVNDKQNLVIRDRELEKFLKYIIKKQAPRKKKGLRPPYLHEIKQIKTNPQTFEIKADQPENIHFSYIRFIKNKLRENFDLAGVGLKVFSSYYRRVKSHQTKKY